MTSNAAIAEIAAAAGDPARASILQTLMDGRALSATELASVANVAPQTASGHLGRMTIAGLLRVEKQGRHRYYRLASEAVAHLVETLMHVASGPEVERPKVVVGPRDAALRAARTCYDHLAGRLGVALTDGLIGGGYVELADDAGLVTEAGAAFFGQIGLDIEGLATRRGGRRTSRLLCRPCLDWSERRPHLAGVVGAAICEHCFAKRWIRRLSGTRAVAVTPVGALGLRETFGLSAASGLVL